MPDGPQVHRGELWTSAEVARAFGVGVSSIKRWTDDGELESVRTPGGHRRYSLPALYRFASIRNLSFHDLPRLEQGLLFEDIPPETEATLYDALVAGDAEGVKQLVTPHVSSTVQRAAFLDSVVGDALRDLAGAPADLVHRAAYLAADALDRLRPRARKDGPLVILACPPGEWHDLPLRLVRLPRPPRRRARALARQAVGQGLTPARHAAARTPRAANSTRHKMLGEKAPS